MKRFAFAVLVSLLSAVVVRADDAPITSLQGRADVLAQIMLPREVGGARIYDQPLAVPEGQVLISLTLEPKAKFDDAHPSITLKSEEIEFGEKGLALVGQFQRGGIFSKDVKELVIQRPKDDDPKAVRPAINLVYTVPAAIVEKRNLPVTIRGKKTVLFANPAQRLFFPILSVPDEQVRWAFAYDTFELPGQKPLTNPGGKILVVHNPFAFAAGTTLGDPTGSLEFDYRDLSVTYDKTADVKPGQLLGWFDDSRKFHTLDDPDTVFRASGITRKQPLECNRTLVFAAPADVGLTYLIHYGNVFVGGPSVHPGAKLVKVESVLDEMVSDPAPGEARKAFIAPHAIKPPEGKKFLRVTAYVIPQFSPRMTCYSPEFKFAHLTDGKERYEPLGGWYRYGVFGKVDSLNVYAPQKYDGKTPLTFNMVYVVPAGAKSFKWSMYDMAADVTMPTKTDKVDVSKIFTAKIKSAKLVDALPSDQGEYKNPEGKLLVVTCDWANTGRTDLDNGVPNSSFSHAALNVTWGKDGAAPCVANLQSNKLIGLGRDGGSNTLTTGGGVGGKSEQAFVFPVPADVKQFNLTYSGWPMAQGVASK